MPWTIDDVDKHRKGLDKNQKVKWVRVANSALKNCIAEGDKDCEGTAVRIANSLFEKNGKRIK